MSNQHYQQFFDWIVASVPEAIKLVEPMQIAPLAGDAGFRRYYRTNTVPSLIAVDSPPAKENNSAYLNIAHALQSQMVRTPIIHGVNTEQGFMLLEDFGEQLLLPALNQQSVASLYDQAENC